LPLAGVVEAFERPGLDRLVKKGVLGTKCRAHRQTQRIGSLEIDLQFKFGRLFDRDVGDLGAPENLRDQSSGNLSDELNIPRSVTDEAGWV
jgi:hypothetical protein